MWGVSPRDSVAAECARRGSAEMVAACVGLLRGDLADERLVFAIAGPASRPVLAGGQQYWLRVWGARALLYAWDAAAAGAALDALLAGLADESWRVREMSAKVIARRQLGGGLTAVAELQADPVPRVRVAASRALAVLTAVGA